MRCWCGSMCRRARGASSRSAPTPAGSPAPTGSACPSRASCRSICRSAAGTPNRGQFDEWRRALPQPLATSAHFATAGASCASRSRSQPAWRSASPTSSRSPTMSSIMRRKQHFRRSGDLAGRRAARRKARRADHFDGVLAIGDGRRAANFTPCPAPFPKAARRSAGSAASLLWAVLGAILGGILLNLMPCVFPILALKALHLSRARRRRAQGARRMRWLIPRARSSAPARSARRCSRSAPAGAEAGWAFQLQDPRTIILLLLLAIAITANLIGLFELPVLGGSARPAGGFATGALAAFVATPCAGPFLGAALGTALLLPPAGSVLVFAALGLGLGAAVPGHRAGPGASHRLPKPGHWMKRLQRFLAIPMGASAVAALWLLYRQAGHAALLVALVALAALTTPADLVRLCAAARGARRLGDPASCRLRRRRRSLCGRCRRGRRCGPERRRRRAVERSAVPRAMSAGPARVRLFHRRLVPDAARSTRQRRSTATRCATRSSRPGVKVLAGDWTNGDPAITRFLESQGRAGVPYYLWYAPGKPPEALPQILTPSMLISRAQSAKR